MHGSSNKLLIISHCKNVGCDNQSSIENFKQCLFPREAMLRNMIEYLNPRTLQFQHNCRPYSNKSVFDLLMPPASYHSIDSITFTAPFRYQQNCVMYSSSLDASKSDSKNWYFLSPIHGIVWCFLLPILLFDLACGFKAKRTNRLSFYRKQTVVLSIGALAFLYNTDFKTTTTASSFIVPMIKTLADLNSAIRSGYVRPALAKQIDRSTRLRSVLDRPKISHPDYAELYCLLKTRGMVLQKYSDACSVVNSISGSEHMIAFNTDRILLRYCSIDEKSQINIFCYSHASAAFRLARGSKWVEKANRGIYFIRSMDDSMRLVNRDAKKIKHVPLKFNQIKLEIETVRNLLALFMALMGICVLVLMMEIKWENRR